MSDKSQLHPPGPSAAINSTERSDRVPHLYAVEIFGSQGEATIEYLGRRYRMFAASDGQLYLLPRDE